MGIFDKLFKKGKQIQQEAQSQQKEPDPITKEEIQQEPEQLEITIPEKIGDCQIAYKYTDVKLTTTGVPLSKIIPTDQLTLLDDGENICVKQKDNCIGYLPKNRLSGMVRDWDKSGDPYLAYIANYDDEGENVEIFLIFYSNLLEKFMKKNKEAKLVKLTGKPEEFASPEKGKKCEVEYDYEKEKYYVSLDSMMIGWLPAVALKYAESKGIEPTDLDVIIADIEYDFEKDRDIISAYISD